jgi:hypothetical protein
MRPASQSVHTNLLHTQHRCVLNSRSHNWATYCTRCVSSCLNRGAPLRHGCSRQCTVTISVVAVMLKRPRTQSTFRTQPTLTKTFKTQPKIFAAVHLQEVDAVVERLHNAAHMCQTRSCTTLAHAQHIMYIHSMNDDVCYGNKCCLCTCRRWTP